MLIYVLDLRWLALLAPAVALVVWARVRSSAARRFGPDRPGPTGREVAAKLLPTGAAIVSARGPTADLYDHRNRTLRLSPRVAEGTCRAALAIAAHEAAHAPGPDRLHTLIAPTAALATDVAWLVVASGLLLGDYELQLVGLKLWWLALLAGLVDLPAERAAARRAIAALGPDPAIEAAPWRRLAALGSPFTR